MSHSEHRVAQSFRSRNTIARVVDGFVILDGPIDRSKAYVDEAATMQDSSGDIFMTDSSVIRASSIKKAEKAGKSGKNSSEKRWR